MKLKRVWTMFKARNREYFRDRAAFGWNFLFPFLIIAGFAIVFDEGSRNQYKVGLFPVQAGPVTLEDVAFADGLHQVRHLKFIGFETRELGLHRLKHHKIDLLLEIGPAPYNYWVSDSSPNGYIAEHLFMGSLDAAGTKTLVHKNPIKGRHITYIDWLFPGILGMNMMFSALYGVGYVVVLYRKTGVLKRLHATPLSALEYLTAQMLSRIFLLMFSLIIVWVGCDWIFSFEVAGSYFDLLVVFLLGGLSLTALGLILAARGASEEFINGILNFISWPMMFLSEVWFSIEGSPAWVQAFAKCLPLTHILTGVRKIMNDGASLMDVKGEVGILMLMTAAFLVVGASLFSWNR
jgi:ABC-type polysaccharide/polyol phosphate export permease